MRYVIAADSTESFRLSQQSPDAASNTAPDPAISGFVHVGEDLYHTRTEVSRSVTSNHSTPNPMTKFAMVLAFVVPPSLLMFLCESTPSTIATGKAIMDIPARKPAKAIVVVDVCLFGRMCGTTGVCVPSGWSALMIPRLHRRLARVSAPEASSITLRTVSPIVMRSPDFSRSSWIGTSFNNVSFALPRSERCGMPSGEK